MEAIYNKIARPTGQMGAATPPHCFCGFAKRCQRSQWIVVAAFVCVYSFNSITYIPS